MTNLTTPFEKIKPCDYDEVITGLQKNISKLKILAIDELIKLSEKYELDIELKEVEVTELQEANEEYLLAISTLNDLGIRQLIKITELQEENKTLKYAGKENAERLEFEKKELQNSLKELKAALISIAAWVASETQGDDYTEKMQTKLYNNVVKKLKALSITDNKELDDEH